LPLTRREQLGTAIVGELISCKPGISDQAGCHICDYECTIEGF
jgi:hypothetical protein